MSPEVLSLSEDLHPLAIWAVLGLCLVTCLLLAFETRRRSGLAVGVLISGIAGVLFLALAILRPTRVHTIGQEVPSRVLVLSDGSHRLTLPADDSKVTRLALRERALKELKSRLSGADVQVLEFGDGAPVAPAASSPVVVQSDLNRALVELSSSVGERPQAIFVLSDGRLSSPGPFGGESWTAEFKRASQGLPMHTVRLADSIPADRSLRHVNLSGTAVAHQSFRVEVVIGCEPVELCEGTEVVVRELLEGREKEVLSRGRPEGSGSERRLELEVTLERAGGRVIEVAIEGAKDELPHNDRRLIPVEVRRDRTRILHVAGRPTYDVRALRMFLKSDASIDLISFFILRTRQDQVHAPDAELSLIPFPVDELFTDHLKSFDAVILQDIDARTYELDVHFPRLRDYVLSGGGLILVGGPSGFSAGGYADSPIEEVLPVELPKYGEVLSRSPVVPAYTQKGRSAPVLAGLRRLTSDALPEMSGSNRLGPPRPSGLVLWEHPDLLVEQGSTSSAMPLLALGEVGDGRSIALAVDATHKLRFGPGGGGGEAHSALWEGLLGWLMRDPRYEVAQVRLSGPCLVGRNQELVVTPLPGSEDAVTVQVIPLSAETEQGSRPLVVSGRSGREVRFSLMGLSEGGYAAKVSVGEAPPARFVFACEVGGEAHADSRPDPERLQAMSSATGGVSVSINAIDDLPQPERNYIAQSRTARPVFPAWVWAFLATVTLALHWWLRRLAGLV